MNRRRGWRGGLQGALQTCGLTLPELEKAPEGSSPSDYDVLVASGKALWVLASGQAESVAAVEQALASLR